MNYVDHLLSVTSTVIKCISISAFTSLIGIPIRIASYTVGLKICVITAYRSIIIDKKNEHDK